VRLGRHAANSAVTIRQFQSYSEPIHQNLARRLAAREAAAEGLARNFKFFGARRGGLIDITDGVQEAGLFQLDD
jgi:hypothetical protein